MPLSAENTYFSKFIRNMTSMMQTFINLLCETMFVNLFLKKIQKGCLKYSRSGTNDGFTKSYGSHTDTELVADIHVINPLFFYHVVFHGDMGFAEAYMQNYFDTTDMCGLLKVLAKNNNVNHSKIGKVLTFISSIYNRITHWMRHNSIENSKHNVSYHYDMSNKMYGLFLDQTMTYSCGIFKNIDETVETLSDAQLAKYDRIIEKLRITENDRVLEIGCGWGGFATRVVEKTGCTLVGLSLSREQLNYANAVVLKKGLQQKIDLRYQDYRDIKEDFTKVVSIEMIEAVGHEYLDSYFKKISDSIPNHGEAMIQVIAIPDNRYESYRKGCDFIQKYIFPGGLCPSIGSVNEFSSKNNLVIVDVKNFGNDYAKTLRLWRKKFNSSWENIKELGFDDRFRKMWNYYLYYCEVGFDLDLIQLYQVKFIKATPFT